MSNGAGHIITGDCRTVLASMEAESVDCCVTSPPYWGLRDYGIKEQIGLEAGVDLWVSEIVAVMEGVRRVMKPSGSLWINLGDSYNAYNGNRGKSHGENKNHLEIMPQFQSGHGLTSDSCKAKDLIGQPWLVAFALRAAGWYLRSDIIWHKPNPMPESVRDRPTKSHEYIFLLSKGPKYFYDAGAIAEPVTGSTEARLSQDVESQTGSLRAHAGGKTNGAMKAVGGRLRDGFRGGNGTRYVANRSHDNDAAAIAGGASSDVYVTERNSRSVWTIPTQGYSGAHFATFPRELAARCIKAGCPFGGLVLDPFAGTGTTVAEAVMLGRRGVGIELNPAYADLARHRIDEQCGLLALTPGAST